MGTPTTPAAKTFYLVNSCAVSSETRFDIYANRAEVTYENGLRTSEMPVEMARAEYRQMTQDGHEPGRRISKRAA